MSDGEPIGTMAEMQIALDAAIEENRCMAKELALADRLAEAAGKLIEARRDCSDLVLYYATLASALANYTWAVENRNIIENK